MSAAADETVYIGADGTREYPCRCGVTHRGPYGSIDYDHHNCFHDSPLVELGPEDPGHLLCPHCGKSFSTDSRSRD